jgi:hypothetical protein
MRLFRWYSEILITSEEVINNPIFQLRTDVCMENTSFKTISSPEMRCEKH